MNIKGFFKGAIWILFNPLKINYIFDKKKLDILRRMSLAANFNCEGLLKVQKDDSSYVGSKTYISVPKSSIFHLGNNVAIGANCNIAVNGYMAIGNKVTIQYSGQLIGEVSIGSGCLFGPNLYISSRSHTYGDPAWLPITYQDKNTVSVSRKVMVGEDCWVGANVVIMPGITIGKGSVIGANSVVVKNLPPYSIASGNPAKIIGKRLDFAPPRCINVEHEKDAPYLYSGFSLPEVPSDLKSMGRVSQKKFEISLNVENSNYIELEFMCQEIQSIKFCNEIKKLSNGLSKIKFHIKDDKKKLHCFYWQNMKYRSFNMGLRLIKVSSGNE
jgi:acetyltransferase-like isoleucine patch superfamily enzyme